MAKLKKEHKELIVISLAHNFEPTEVQRMLKDRCDVEVELNQISYYNPDLNSSAQLSKTWRELYHHKKDQYKDEVLSHETAHKAYRIGMLEKAAKEYQKKGNYMAMASMLEQIAKEVGGVFEGKVPEGGSGNSVTNFTQNIYQKIQNYNGGPNE